MLKRKQVTERSSITLCLFLAWCVAISPLLAQETGGANPFRDVPPDHWSVKAINKLVSSGLIEGFPDGTFKGNKVITRYDLALHIARMLAKIDELKREGKNIGPEDAITVSRLTNEYKAELDLLGVKVDRLEKRLLDVEAKADKLDQSLSNVRIEGFYRIENFFVDEPYDFTDYPYSPFIGKNPFHDKRHSGLYNLEQTAYLRFIGQPFIKGEQRKNIRAFIELEGHISGLNENTLRYGFSDPPTAGDNLDDFATGIEDQRRVSVSRAHLKIDSARVQVRAFSNEAINDLSDPMGLLSGGAEHTWKAGWTEDFTFDQGLEFKGSHRKLSYFGSVLKDLSTDSSGGANPGDLSETFQPVTETDKDVFSARFTYDMFKDPSGEAKNSLVLGTSYVETIWNYDERDAFNRVIGADLAFEHNGDLDFDLTINPMWSRGKGDVSDRATMIDSRLRMGRMTALLKHYEFGYDFQSVAAVRPWVDTHINRNFRRYSAVGEHFTRGQVKFELGDSVARGIEDLTLTMLYEEKWFERNPSDHKDTDEITGMRAYLQTLADLTDKTHIELSSEFQKDVLPDEIGCWTHSLSADFKVFDETSMVGEISFIDDYDQRDDEHRHFSQRRGKFSVNSQVNKWLFLNGYVEVIKNDKTHSRNYVNGRDVNSVGGEMTINVRDDLTIKGWVDRKEVEDSTDTNEDGITDTVVGEFGWNFTRALKFKYVHGFKDIDKVNTDDDFVINDYAELFYRPTEQTELRLSYGYDYENPADYWDNGVLEFWRTNKAIRLTAQTNF